MEELGNRLWAGEPVYDERRKQWSVPIHSRSLSEDRVLGQVTLNAQGVVVRAPSRRALQRAAESQAVETKTESPTGRAATPLLDAIRNLLPRVPQPATVRDSGTRGEGAAAEEEPSLSLDTLTQDLQNDPAFFAAVVNLRAALADPKMRLTVLDVLEKFAQAARPSREE